MIEITEPITIEQVLPLVEKLSKVERLQLRRVLEADGVSWEDEWERVTADFRAAFGTADEAKVEADLQAALEEVRRERR